MSRTQEAAAFQYPPDLFQALVETLPKLTRSKRDLLLFFQGAGSPANLLAPYWKALADRDSAANKYAITREVLAKLNELGDTGIAARRELLKRVVEFEEFSLCWESEQSSARGLVAQVREIVNVKDSFTRIRLEREEERRQRVAEREASAQILRHQRQVRDQIKADLFALFAKPDANKRGTELQGVLNRLFAAHRMSVKEAFSVTGLSHEGVVEQVDGAVELQHVLYLVEMKWLAHPIGPGDLAPHLVRLFARGGEVRGLFLSYSDYTQAAQANCRDALAAGRVLVLATLEEIVGLLNEDGDLADWLDRKATSALTDRQPFVRV